MVSIIILNWNGWSDTIECVKSCLSLAYDDFEIIIVDNGSDDDSEAILKSEFPDLNVLQTGVNLGYAGGNNYGVKHAIAKGAEYVWFLNNDTIVDPMALTELVNVAEMDPDNGMVGSKILSYLDPAVIQYAGGLLDANSGTSKHIGFGEKDHHQYDQVAETGYITGCSMLVKSPVIDRIGMMDECYFLYFEESDWCIKAQKNGIKLMYVPDSVVYHKESASTRKVTGAMSYYMTRNRLYFMSRNAENPRWGERFRSDLLGLLRFIYQRDAAQVRSIFDAYRHWATGYMGCRHSLSRIRRS